MPAVEDVPARYSIVAILLHWAVAAAIVALVLIGWNMVDLPLSPRKLELYALHKSIGLTVLGLAVLRLAWRWLRRPPPPDPMPRWQEQAAAWAHRLLYALLFLLPLTGWLFNSIVGFPLSWFGFVTLPPLAPALPAWREASADLHHWLGWILIVVVALHAAGALHHQFILRDATLWRMLPLWPRRKLGLVAAAALLVLPGTAGAATWLVDPGASRLGFRALQAGAPFDGAFAKWDAKIAFDPADLAAGSVTATIDVASVGTGAPDRDRELPKSDWFDLARFPQAVFTASSFTGKGGDAYLATGTLTIRDHTVPVALPFTLKIAGDTATMDGSVEIDRTTFGVGQGQWATSDIVGKAVTVTVHIVAKKG